MHVHDCFDFQHLPGHPQGFACGDDSLDNAPLLLDSKPHLWSSAIYAAIEKAFTSTGTDKHKAIARRHGQGYEALFQII